MIRYLLLCAITFMPMQAAAEQCTILLLGDSLSAAHGMSTREGWASLLDKRLADQGYGCRVINASNAGDTTQGGRARLPSLLQQYRPSYLLLELGANNGLRALPTAAMEADLSAMIETARAARVQVLLIGMRMPPNYGPLYTEQFAAVYTRLAKRYRVPLVPFLLQGVITRPEWMQADAMHPKAEAQMQLLDNIWMQLKTLL